VHHYGVDGHVRNPQRLVWYTLSISSQVFRIILFNTLDSVLQKKSTKVDPYYLDVWKLAHEGDAIATEKLVSNNF
jgi:hypothetical protein